MCKGNKTKKPLTKKQLDNYQMRLKDKNSKYYKENLLDGRNVVAKIDTVWVADMFSPRATIEQPNNVQGSTDINL